MHLIKKISDKCIYRWMKGVIEIEAYIVVLLLCMSLLVYANKAMLPPLYIPIPAINNITKYRIQNIHRRKYATPRLQKCNRGHGIVNQRTKEIQENTRKKKQKDVEPTKLTRLPFGNRHIRGTRGIRSLDRVLFNLSRLGLELGRGLWLLLGLESRLMETIFRISLDDQWF